MNVRRLFFAVPIVGAALTAPLAAQTPYTLPAYCPHSTVPAPHGDVLGLVDFSYEVRTAFGAGASNATTLFGWTTGYSDLACAFWGGTSSNPTWVADILIDPLGSPNTVRVDELLFGRWTSSLSDIEVRIYNGDYSSLLYTGNLLAVSNIAKTIAPGTVATGPIHLQWDDPWFSGLGRADLTFGVPVAPALVPEPATVGLTALGLAALAVARRRRA